MVGVLAMKLPALRALGRGVDEDSVRTDEVKGSAEGLHVKARVREAISITSVV